MSSTLRNVTTTTTPDELQVRNGQDHQRVYNPESDAVLFNILKELKQMNTHLQIITGEKL